MHRRRMHKSKDKRIFSKTAKHVHPRNSMVGVARGGIRM